MVYVPKISYSALTTTKVHRESKTSRNTFLISRGLMPSTSSTAGLLRRYKSHFTQFGMECITSRNPVGPRSIGSRLVGRGKLFLRYQDVRAVSRGSRDDRNTMYLHIKIHVPPHVFCESDLGILPVPPAASSSESFVLIEGLRLSWGSERVNRPAATFLRGSPARPRTSPIR